MIRWLLMLASILLWGCADISEGAARWNAGSPEAALEAWTSGDGVSSASLHYNLGVAAYRADELPLAIAHWRAARRMEPRAGDVVHNLAMARGELSGVPRPVGEPLGWMEFTTPAELGILAMVLLAMMSWALWRRRHEAWPGWVAWAALMGAILGSMATHGVWVREAETVAVLLDEAALRESPASDGVELGALGAGAEVRATGARGPWVRVESVDGRRGWVPAGTVLLAGPLELGAARVVGRVDRPARVPVQEPSKP